MELFKIYKFGNRHTRGEVEYISRDDWNWPCSAEILARLGGKIENRHYLCRMLHMGSYEGIPFPLEFLHERGKRYYDILHIGYATLFLVSDRFLEVLKENRFTGWKSYPVRLFEKDGTEVLGYNGFSITGRAGKIDWTQCEIVQVPGPVDESITYPRYKGIPIDMNEWDGSDFFLACNYGFSFLTESVYKVIKKAQITNIKLDKITESLIPID